MPMSDNELLALVGNAESDAVTYNGEFSRINERLLKDYLQKPYGDEVDDQSQVVSPDVQDVVESDLPSLARIFLGATQPVEFEPKGSSERELKEVEEKNKYINHLIMGQPSSYQTIFSWMKDAEIQKNGVVKYFMETTEKTEEVSYTGVDEQELTEIVQDLDRDDVQSVEVVGRGEQSEEDIANGKFDITFKVKTKTQKTKIIGVPSEQFLISKQATCIEDAELVGDKVSKSRGQLLSEGFKKDLINQLPKISADRSDNSTLKTIRDRDTGNTISGTQSIKDWANEMVELTDLYVLIDYDQDGIAERRHILKSGNHILVNEAFDHEPYASLSCLLMPHKAIGRSRAELTQQTQRVKTVVTRQTLNNIYSVNSPRSVVSPDVNVDDMLKIRPNGIVRMKKNSIIPPAQAVMPLVVPYIGQQSLQILQYMDGIRAQSTGTYQANQGLDADAIGKETATRFTGIEEKGAEKLQLVARTFAETGFRKLYEGVAWVISHFQDTKTEIRVLGKPLKIDPTAWRHQHQVVSKVGLGSSNSDQLIGEMQGILGIQQQLQAAGSPMVDQVKMFNTLTEITKGLGFKNVGSFFNDPEQPEQLLQAENEILKSTLQQMQAQLEQMQNPLAEAETIKAQAKLIEAQGKGQLQAATKAEDARQFNIKTIQQAKEHEDNLALDLTKLEVESGQDIPGSAI